ncbi:hypothetical protein [Actinoplanes sp. HUAS TT8]|uniref:hypothetical protein n=1 Tax=Actinoplanes sp. HUAS TT8 TaxID=3447453 RepID=UPI003F5235DF
MSFDSPLHLPEKIGDTTISSYSRWTEGSTIGTLINAPTLAVPAELSTAELPHHLQIIGRNHDDYALMNSSRLGRSRPPPSSRCCPRCCADSTDGHGDSQGQGLVDSHISGRRCRRAA